MKFMNSELLADALEGLRQTPKTLPSKWFYDAIGSRIIRPDLRVARILSDRTEAGILETHSDQIAQSLGENIVLIEFGSGSSLKTRALLRRLQSPRAYVPLDISGEHLKQSAAQLQLEFPDLPIVPVAADYNRPWNLPELPRGERVLFFPGSTLGNFAPEEAVSWLARAREIGSRLLIGIDLRKSTNVLLPAYNDASGVTATFNLNLLARLNREIGANFDLQNWLHRAIWNDSRSRIEMWLIAKKACEVFVDERMFCFDEGEGICSEWSHKYTLAGFEKLVDEAGWCVERHYEDPQNWFSVQLLRAN
jgi:dimethylhistidine N-methyltransferase